MSTEHALQAEGPSDAELVGQVLAGRRDEYALLVRRYQERLYRHALGMVGEPDAAADLVQDAFIKGYSSLSACQDPARYGAWVFRILRNRCLDYLKDRRRDTRPLEEGAPFAVAADDPDADLDRAELRRAVGSALETLPAAQREAFLLKHVDGRSYEEMAEMVGATESALKMRVKRAREALQALLAVRERAEM